MNHLEHWHDQLVFDPFLSSMIIILDFLDSILHDAVLYKIIRISYR